MHPDPTTGNKPWLAISGPAGVGKDHLGLVLEEKYGFTVVKFAHRLRQMVETLDPVVGCGSLSEPIHLSEALEMYGYEKAKFEFPEFRRLLQVFGTEVIRTHVDNDFWVNDAMRQAEEAGTPVVFTDCRFPNEAERVRLESGYVVRMTSHGLDSVNEHSSESSLDDYDFDMFLENPRVSKDRSHVQVASLAKQVADWLEVSPAKR